MNWFSVHRNTGQWLLAKTWAWSRTPPSDGDHGFYPFRWMAWIAGWIATR